MISDPLGTYPTPVERWPHLDRGRASLWIKRDDLTHPEYGGNKVRKLEHALAVAKKRGANRIVTVGAVGSHHVLATTFFGRRAGFEVEAVLVPQPTTPTAEAIARAALGLGLRPHPASTMATGFLRTLARAGEGTYVIPVGGSNVEGVLGYVDAAHELAAQIRSGRMPTPDLVVVTLGSGGTAAGIALGLAAAGIDTRVLGVAVSDPAIVVRGLVTWLIVQSSALVASTSRTFRLRSPSALADAAQAMLTCTTDFMGKGYAHPTSEGDEAVRIAAGAGLTLDPTYTGKTFAAALAAMAQGDVGNVLYWHTLSSAPFEPLLVDAPAALPPEIARLLR